MDVRRVTISESLAQYVQVCKVSLGRGDLPPGLLYQVGGGLKGGSCGGVGCCTVGISCIRELFSRNISF